MQADLSGQRLGKYVLKRVLGRGGMGEVYEALDPETGRTVAIKVLPASLSVQPGYLERFAQELKLAASLEHIHILPIYDHGTENGMTYIVMRYLTGSDLQKRMYKLGHPSAHEAKQLLRQIAQALDYAHSRGVVHRDLKPNNIMFDDQGNAYLGDFGIAKVIGTSAGLTGTGQIIGTPYYMAPEQVQAGDVDARADLYSFGIIAFQLLTGELPFDAPTPYALMYKHLNDPPPRPSEIQANLDPRVDAILERALAKDPDDRYQTARELVEDLEAVLSHIPETEQRTGFMTVTVDTEDRERTYTPPRTPRSRPRGTGKRLRLIGAVVLFLVVVVVGTVLLMGDSLIGGESTETSDDAAIASDSPTFRTGTRETPLAAAPTDTLQSGATTSPPSNPTPLNPVDAVDTAEAEETATQIARQTMVETQRVIDATLTATLWTATPTANLTATFLAIRTERAGATETQIALDVTNTATLWTDTPTDTPTATFTRTPTDTPTQSPFDIAEAGVTTNAEWEPVVQEFDGVEMVLVPAGCFMMGSEDGSRDESPAHEICFDEPFWIDRYEVSQGDFARLGGTQSEPSYFTADNQPVEMITWFESRDFCELRGGRLPTEAEWEYAARGPDGLVYPWGNSWDPSRLHGGDSSPDEPLSIGSFDSGVSWVGAYDLAGNVWEWTSTIFQEYPYHQFDGRESISVPRSARVLRGGSWSNSDANDFRAPVRLSRNPIIRTVNNGFRCARDYDSSSQPVAVYPTPAPDILALAETGVTTNAEWEPVVQEFDGVEMVLVPAGCFMMGSEDGSRDESPAHEFCFDEPFWIDRYEVAQGDFSRLGGTQSEPSYFTADNQPVEMITWFESRDFCELRGGRLPTEAEWEYAARGPDGLVYPWGNSWDPSRLHGGDSSPDEPLSIGSFDSGVSWVGAYDLAGNVWEWTSTIFQDYPYNRFDGRESISVPRSARVLRGGSWSHSDANDFRTSVRLSRSPIIRTVNNGFRCVRSY